RHLQSREAAPGNSEHANVPVRPRLVRQPSDDLFTVYLFLLRILALRRNPFTGAESANIDPHAQVAAPRKICVLGIISRGRPIIFAVGKIFEQSRELLSRLRAVWHI